MKNLDGGGEVGGLKESHGFLLELLGADGCERMDWKGVPACGCIWCIKLAHFEEL